MVLLRKNLGSRARDEDGRAALVPSVGACLVAGLLLLPSCSWLFVQPLSESQKSRSFSRPPDCTSNRAAPVIDTIFIITNVLSALYVAGQPNVTNKGSSVGLGLSVAGIWTASAIYGYSNTSECEDAKREYDGVDDRPVRVRRSRQPSQEWTPPPVTAAPPSPAGALPAVPGVPPTSGVPASPDGGAPGNAPVQVAPSAPVPAVPAVPQQADDDVPSPARRRP